jgi:hypothetical protein
VSAPPSGNKVARNSYTPQLRSTNSTLDSPGVGLTEMRNDDCLCGAAGSSLTVEVGARADQMFLLGRAGPGGRFCFKCEKSAIFFVWARTALLVQNYLPDQLPRKNKAFTHQSEEEQGVAETVTISQHRAEKKKGDVS